MEQLAEELGGKDFPKVAVVHGSKRKRTRKGYWKALGLNEQIFSLPLMSQQEGLDVPHVSLVVNYHMSKKFEEYIHRIGRTGRAGQKGASYTFVDGGDKDTFGSWKVSQQRRI